MISIPAKTKLAIFDIDGTLTDSVFVHQKAFHSALRNAQLTPYDDDFLKYKHHTDSYIANTIFSLHRKRNMTDEDINRFENDVYRLTFKYLKGKPFSEIPGAVAFVNYLHLYTPYAVIYATGSFRKLALYKLSIGFPNVNESLLFSCNREQVREKIVLNAIKNAKNFYKISSYKKIIAFGDGIWDWKVAQNLGIDFIAVGFNCRQTFADFSCQEYFDDFMGQQLLFEN